MKLVFASLAFIGVGSLCVASAQGGTPTQVQYQDYNVEELSSSFGPGVLLRRYPNGLAVHPYPLRAISSGDSYWMTELGPWPVQGGFSALAVQADANFGLSFEGVGSGSGGVIVLIRLNTQGIAPNSLEPFYGFAPGFNSSIDEAEAAIGLITWDGWAHLSKLTSYDGQGFVSSTPPGPATDETIAIQLPWSARSTDTQALIFGPTQNTFSAPAGHEFEITGVGASGDLVVLVGQTGALAAPGELWFYRRNAIGGWGAPEVAALPFPADQAVSVQLSASHVFVNSPGDAYAVYDSTNGIQIEDQWAMGTGEARRWVAAAPDGTLERYTVVDSQAFEPLDWKVSSDVAGVPSSGGSQVLSVQGLPTFAGVRLFWLGSITGTSPGVPYGGEVLPLNPDTYFDYLQTFSGSSNVINQIVPLDADGQATTTVILPPLDASLIGLSLNHAALAFRPDDGSPIVDLLHAVLGPVALDILPPQ